MLPPQSLELLTAYLDGELSPRQRRAVDRLLSRSDEARALLDRLRADADRIRNLPGPAAPADLSKPVLAAIARRRLRPGRRPAARRATFPLWTGYAAAAAVLLVVAAATFFDSTASVEPPPEGDAASQRADSDDPRPTPPAPRDPIADGNPAPPASRPPVPPDGEEPVWPDLPRDPAPNRPTVPTTPEHVRPDDRVHTSPIREGHRGFHRVEADLPEVYPLYGLKQAANADRLAAQLVTATTFRVEVPCRDATRGFGRLRAALTRRGVALVVDPSAQALLSKPQWKTDYALFVENLTPGQLTTALADAGAADFAAAKKRAADRRFDGTLVVKPASAADRRELTGLLGVDPLRVRPSGPAGGPTGMVLNLSAAAGRRTPELKRFLDGRRAAAPGTLQVLLVLRNVGS